MHEYYELPNATGNTSSYFVSDPSIQITNAIQDLLLKECMMTQVNNIVSGHLNLIGYINTILPNLENIYLQDHLIAFSEITKKHLNILNVFLGNTHQHFQKTIKPNNASHKSWKKDLSYVRAMEIMTGYILSFYLPAENLAVKLKNWEISKSIRSLQIHTQDLLNTITQISVQLINNKFIN